MKTDSLSGYDYAKIDKSRLNLTHLILFWGRTGGGGLENIFWYMPLCFCGAVTDYFQNRIRVYSKKKKKTGAIGIYADMSLG